MFHVKRRTGTSGPGCGSLLMEPVSEHVPYCGAPPVPGDLTWNTDPWLIAGLLFLLIPLFRLVRPAGEARQFAAGLGWGLVALALVSPLCHLSMALFSARIAQHMLLVLVAAPLLAFALPPLIRARSGMGWGAGLAAGLLALMLWAWHLPGPYDATLKSDALYWIMHLTLFGSAVWLWRAVFATRAERPLLGLVAGFATAAQTSLLSGLLTLASRPLFAVHEATTWPWGLTQLEDQQLGGLIMWVPGGLAFTLVALAGFARWLSLLEESSAVAAE